MVGTCEHYVKWVVHVPRLLYVTIQKAIYLISLYHKTNIYTKRMRRLLSVIINYISGERYISYKVTH